MANFENKVKDNLKIDKTSGEEPDSGQKPQSETIELSHEMCEERKEKGSEVTANEDVPDVKTDKDIAGNSVADETDATDKSDKSGSSNEKLSADEMGTETSAEEEEDSDNSDKKKTKKWIVVSMRILVNVFRFIIAFTLLFSAFVKANDPVGFSIKLKDYALALGMTFVPQFLMILACFVLVAIETILGIYMFVGVKRRKRISGTTMIFFVVMTIVTVWIYKDNPVSDCGCFGDAVKLTNGQSLAKNIVLLLMSLVTTIKSKMMFRLVHKNWNWIVTIPVVVAMMAYVTYSRYMLPSVDFLPFAEGTDLRKIVALGDGLDLRYKVTIVYKRGNEILELSDEDDDPDPSWKYVETRSELLNDNVAGTTEFFVNDSDGDDITEDILNREGYSFLITMPDMETASDAIGGKFSDMYDYARKFGYGFYFIAGTPDEATKESWYGNTDTEYEICESDERILWQMVRDNPGLILLEDGVVVKKWSQFNLPFFDYTQPLDKDRMQELLKVKRCAVKPLDFTNN